MLHRGNRGSARCCQHLPLLAKAHRHQRKLGRQITRKAPQSVMQALQQHPWPGNVRELQNVVERAMIASDGDTLHLDDPLPSSAWMVAWPNCRTTSDTIQRSHIEAVLERCGWRINGAGQCGGTPGHSTPTVLRFRMKKLGVGVSDRPQPTPAEGAPGDLLKAGGASLGAPPCLPRRKLCP